MRHINSCFQPIEDVRLSKRIGYEATIQGRSGESAKMIFDWALLQGQSVFNDLDRYARNLAMQEGERILAAGDGSLFLNVSSLDGIEREVDAYLERNIIDRLVFEITELVTIDPAAVRLINRLAEKGVIFAIDDFGKGLANWHSLIELPITYVKMDMMFARNLDRPITHGVVKNMVELCEENGIDLIWEGIETERQYRQLEAMGCRYMQGYHFGRPTIITHGGTSLKTAFR